MLRTWFFAALAAAGLAIAGATVADSLGEKEFEARLTGAAETVPVDTPATGKATFDVEPAESEEDDDGEEQSVTRVRYKLKVKKITDVLMAHIHLAPAGTNGPIKVWLYPAPDQRAPLLKPGTFSGTLAKGSFTEADMTGITMDDLLAAMESGQAYVNVHTVAHPGGEIRGQIALDDED